MHDIFFKVNITLFNFVEILSLHNIKFPLIKQTINEYNNFKC